MAKHRYELLAGQAVTADRSRPIRDADGNPVPNRYERKAVVRGGTVESDDPKLAEKEPERYRLVGGTADAARIRELEAEIAKLKGQKAGPAAPLALENPSVAPGGQVSTGFQQSLPARSGPLDPALAARAGVQGVEEGEGEKAEGRNVARGPARDDLDDLTVKEMRQVAEKEGIDLKGCTHRDDVVEAIRRHRAE